MPEELEKLERFLDGPVYDVVGGELVTDRSARVSPQLLGEEAWLVIFDAPECPGSRLFVSAHL